MPYNAYLTDTDRAIDRDANEMLSPRAGYSGAGYLAQGYANMDVLPEQLALADMLERRQSLSIKSRMGRKEQRDEDVAAADQEGLDGYSNFVRGTAGMTDVERATAMRDRALNNPEELNNPLINKQRGLMMAGDKAVLDAKQNALQAAQNDLDLRQTGHDAETFEKRMKLQDAELANARAQAELTSHQVSRSKHALESGDLGDFGRNVFGLDAFSEEEKPMREKLIKIGAQLSTDDNPSSRKTLMSLMDITGGIATGNRVKELKGHLIRQNSKVLRNVAALTAGKGVPGIDLANLPADPAKRQQAIQIAENAVRAKNDPQLTSDFVAFVDKANSYSSTEESLATLKRDFFQSIDKIDELRKSKDPAAQQELQDELAVLYSRSAEQAAHFDREHQTIEEGLKIRDKESQIEARYSAAAARIRAGNLADKKLGYTQYVDTYKQQAAAEGAKLDKVKAAEQFIKDDALESLGLPDDASLDQIMKALDKVGPPVQPGLGRSDLK